MADDLANTPLAESKTGIRLRRELGLFSAINLIVAIIIGSGVFVSPAATLKYSGSIGLCLVVWIVCGIISLFGALAFAELATVIHRSGAEYSYYMDTFGPMDKFWGRLPSFIYSYIIIFVTKPTEVAIVTLTFSEYACQPVLDMMGVKSSAESELAKKCIALLALGVITYINISSVKLYVKVQNIFGSFKILACLVVICGGIYAVARGDTSNLRKGFEGTTNSPRNIALAFYSALWAYDGWSAVTIVTEEIKRPEVNIPRSISIGVPLITLLYVFMNVAYMSVLSVPEMINSHSVAVSFGQKILGPVAFLIPLGVAAATFGCALSLQFAVTRICYVAGQDGLMMKSLSFVHYKKLTPCVAVVLEATITFWCIVVGEVVQLIEFVGFLVWLFYGLAIISLLVLRRTKKDVHRPYKVPTWIAIVFLLVVIFLTTVPIATDPSPKYLFGVTIIFIGVFIYYWFVYKKNAPDAVMKSLTRFMQILFEVVPPEYPTSTSS